MATHREDLLQQLEVKLNLLTQRYEKLQKRQQIVDALQEENALLKKNYESLKMAKTLALGEGDIRQARTQLSRLIRQIDTCISLLTPEK